MWLRHNFAKITHDVNISFKFLHAVQELDCPLYVRRNCWRLIMDEYYFNTTIKEYKVIYHDETSGYIAKDGFDGIQVILF